MIHIFASSFNKAEKSRAPHSRNQELPTRCCCIGAQVQYTAPISIPDDNKQPPNNARLTSTARATESFHHLQACCFSPSELHPSVLSASCTTVRRCLGPGHFQDRPEKPPGCCCCPWPPPLAPACGGLGAPPDDSLRLNVPLDGGLLVPAATPVVIGASFSGAGDGSDGDGASFCCLGSFFPSASKLPTTICAVQITMVNDHCAIGGRQWRR